MTRSSSGGTNVPRRQTCHSKDPAKATSNDRHVTTPSDTGLRPLPERHFENIITEGPPYPTGNRSRPPLPPLEHHHPPFPAHLPTFHHPKAPNRTSGTGAPAGGEAENAFDISQVFDFASLDTESVDPDTLYHYCRHIIATTQSAADAWAAYSNIVSRPLPPSRSQNTQKIPFQHLHRLCRLLSRNTPKTRTQFMRLLTVMYDIRKLGGEIKLFEWNALMDNAGKGWRSPRPEDFKLALDVFSDMMSGRSPGESLSTDEYPAIETPSEAPVPNIVTYTTLLNIAAETFSATAVRQANALLQASGLPPNRVTHLSLLKYFTSHRKLDGIRLTLLKMRQHDFALGLDGANALLWTFSHLDRVDLVMKIYRVLRHNIYPETYIGAGDVDSDIRFLDEEENILLPIDVRPDKITFSTMIQVMAYHGYFTEMMSAFIDLLSTKNMEVGASLVLDRETGELEASPYSMTMTVFRAIFIGFQKHGVYVAQDGSLSSRLQAARPWSLNNLRQIYDLFVQEYSTANSTLIYAIMVAFDKTSGHDVQLLREVWNQLEERFNGPWGGKGNRLQYLKAKLFSNQAQAHLDRYGFRRAYDPIRRRPGK